MSPQSLRDGDSPSASTFFLTDRRHSRRDSIASTLNTNHIDKESLTQALDHIHNTASQSESLTTFNEYTSPPSSSSGPDPKSIANDLHGGFSGLYNRLRASVGNAKDALNPGGEEGVSGNEVLASPTASSRNNLEASSTYRLSTALSHDLTLSQTGRQRPSETLTPYALKSDSNTSKPSTVPLETELPRSKPTFISGLKPPTTTFAQAKQATVISPSLAEVNVSIVRQGELDAQHSSKSQGDSTTGRAKSVYDHKWQASHDEWVMKDQREGPMIQSFPDSQTTGTRQSNNKRLRYTVDAAPDVSSDARASATVPARHIVDKKPTKDDVFVNSSAAPLSATKAQYQHLDLPLRRSTASPAMSRSNSENPSLSRKSSSGTNTDSLTSSALRTTSHAGQEAIITNKDHSRPTDPASVHRDLRTMNVFSQVKNKVLNKEYWMKDQNAKDCFYCGDPFTTFRRKHHCSKYSLFPYAIAQ